MRDELRADVALLRCVLFVKLPAVLLEVTANLALLFLGEQSPRAWSPEELLKAVEDVLLKLLSTEVPDSVAILNLQCFCQDIMQT